MKIDDNGKITACLDLIGHRAGCFFGFYERTSFDTMQALEELLTYGEINQ